MKPIIPGPALFAAPVIVTIALALHPRLRAEEFGDISANTLVDVLVTAFIGVFVVTALQRIGERANRSHALLEDLLAHLREELIRSRNASREYVRNANDETFDLVRRCLGDLGMCLELYRDVRMGPGVAIEASLQLAHQRFRAAASCDVPRLEVPNRAAELLQELGSAFSGYQRAIARQRSQIC